MTNTTIMISTNLKEELNKMKFHKSETYEDIIMDLIDDRKFLNAETLREIEEARAEYKKGNYSTLAQVKKEAGLDDL